MRLYFLLVGVLEGDVLVESEPGSEMELEWDRDLNFVEEKVVGMLLSWLWLWR